MNIPYSGLMRNISGAQDPVLRDPEGTWEQLQTRLPVIPQLGFDRTAIPPRIRATGEQIERGEPGGFAGRLTIPTQVRSATPDPLTQEMYDLKIPLGVPRDEPLQIPREGHMVEEELPRLESLAVRQAKGFAERAMLEREMARPDWATLDPETKRERMTYMKGAVTSAITEQARVLKFRGEPITFDKLWLPAFGPAPRMVTMPGETFGGPPPP
jgi:hypothetical protein